MSWITPIVKGLAWATVPVKIIDKGLDHAKNEIREEINQYEAKVKTLVLIGSIAFLFAIFCSITFGFLLSSALNSYSAGFGIVTGVHLIGLLGLLFYYKNELKNQLSIKS